MFLQSTKKVQSKQLPGTQMDDARFDEMLENLMHHGSGFFKGGFDGPGI